MKHLPIAAALLTATTAHAGGLSQPINEPRPTARPTVGAPAIETGWAGFYGGLSFGSTTATTDVSPQYIYRCDKGTSHDRHNNNKCPVSSEAWQSSPELQELEINHRPWGQYETPYRYSTRNYEGVWLGGLDSITYSLGAPMEYPGINKPTTTTLVDVISEQITETDGIGGFIGTRWDVTPAFVGGVELSTDGMLSTAELHLGAAMGDLLPYAGVGLAQYYGEAGGVYVAGADLRVSERGFVGGKLTVGDFGDTQTETLGLRVGWSF